MTPTSSSTARTTFGRSARPLPRPSLLDSKPLLPPVETPEGAPGLGFLIAYEEPAAPDGWDAGVVKAIEDGWDGRHFTVETRAGECGVPRDLVFYWWPLD
ncbi:MAG TPA: hypothetical protein VFC23_09835 [Thermoanaerobaculia bacterium]|nr:hypothetical protein [Thermoanaerobaculia bacterium]